MQLKSRQSSCIQVLQKLVATKLGNQRQVLLAYSGGLDSTVLLDILTLLRIAGGNTWLSLSIRAVHIHHGISNHGDSWLLHCEQQCKKYNIPFSAVRITLVDNVKNLEAAARSARYLALEEACLPGEALLIAQHQDDQVETLFLALKRGSGPTGLAAMAGSIQFNHYLLLRPLLTTRRSQLEEYARTRQLVWVEDDSNSNDRFDRNFLRRHILPLFYQRWPQFAKNVASNAQLCAEQEQLLDELLASTLAKLISPEKALYFTPLLDMSAPKRNALLRRWLASRGARMPSRKQLDILWHEVVLSRLDATPKLNLDGQIIRRYRNKIFLLSSEVNTLPRGLCLPWSISVAQLPLGYGLGVLIRQNIMPFTKVSRQYSPVTSLEEMLSFTLSQTAQKVTSNIGYHKVTANSVTLTNILPTIPLDSPCTINQPVRAIIRAPLPHELVSVRFGSVSDTILIVGRYHKRPLKKLWQELGIPPWRRTTTPLMFYNETIVAALGVFVTQDGQALINEPQWWLYWLPNTSSKLA